jgi:hypothetical protein
MSREPHCAEKSALGQHARQVSDFAQHHSEFLQRLSLQHLGPLILTPIMSRAGKLVGEPTQRPLYQSSRSHAAAVVNPCCRHDWCDHAKHTELDPHPGF